MDELEVKIKIIEKLIEADNEDKVCFTRTFIKITGAEDKLVKTILKQLKKIEMVEVDWCIDYDGMLGGRGYVLTQRATQWSIREWLQELKKIKQGEVNKQNA